jgi:hypothetical protein
LGFVQRYKCIGEEEKDNDSLTVALYLNHRLVESYLIYLKEVRNCSDGTIGEALTAAICACRWLYRKEKSLEGSTPQIIRRYMDYRNVYQTKTIRQRSQNDVDELQEQHKWLEWDQFTALVARLRTEWADTIAKNDFRPTSQTLIWRRLKRMGFVVFVFWRMPLENRWDGRRVQVSFVRKLPRLLLNLLKLWRKRLVVRLWKMMLMM